MKITKIDQLFIKQWLYSFFVVLCALLSLLTIFDLLAGISSKKGFNEVVQQVLLSLPSRWVQIDGLTGLLAGVFTFIQLGKHSEWVIMRQLNFSPLRTFTYIFLFSIPLLVTHHFFTEKLILKNELKLLDLKKKEDVEQSSWFIAKKSKMEHL
jgi:lipopolysaccharide export LptBFGC system permease protein LptF